MSKHFQKKIEIEREGYLKVFGNPLRHTKPKKCWVVLKKTGMFCCFKEKIEDKNSISAQDIILTCQLGPNFSIKDKEETPRDKKSKDKLKYCFILEDTTNKEFSLTFYCTTETEAKEWRSLLSAKIEGRKYFGLPLSQLVGPTIGKVPVLVSDAIQRLQQSLNTVGLLRHSGNVALIERWKSAYDRGDKVDLTLEEDPHIVAGILRAFLRELPEPLVGYSNYKRVVDIAKELDQSRQIFALKQLVESLPQENASLLHELMKFFKQIDSQSAVNKMTAKNIAIVMAPVICRSEVARLDLQASSDGNAVVNLVELMILEHETIFQNIAKENSQNVGQAPESGSNMKRARKPRPSLQSVKSMSAIFPTMPSLHSRVSLSARSSSKAIESSSATSHSSTNSFAPLLVPPPPPPLPNVALPPPLVDTTPTTTSSVTTTSTKSHTRRSHTVSFASAPLIKTFDAPIPKPLVEADINVNPPSTPTVEVTPPQPQSESSSVPVSSAPQTEGSQPSESNTRISDSNVNDVQKLHLRLDHIEERLSKIEDTLIQILALLNSSSSSQQISSKEPK